MSPRIPLPSSRLRAVLAGLVAFALAAGAPLGAQSIEPPVSPVAEPERLGTDRPLHAETAPAIAPVPTVVGDPRSVEFLRYDCASELEHREVTLFANGTIRLREGPPGRERMGLAELGPADLAAALRRLGEEDLGEVRSLPSTVTGTWRRLCSFALAVPERAPANFRFGGDDALPLPLSRLLAVADDLARKVTLLEGEEHLPAGYEPARGDRLRRADGVVFEIHAFTDDQKGVELRAVDQPLTLYMRLEDLRQIFVAVEPRFGAPTRRPDRAGAIKPDGGGA